MFKRVGLLVFVFVALILGLILGSGLSLLRDRAAPAPIEISTPAPTITPVPTATAPPIQVFVNGAVAAPDVYSLPPGSRVKQAIEAAGGFSEGANTAVINLALPLRDGVQIYVPEQAESGNTPPQVISEPDRPSRSGTVGIGELLVNINTADLEELDRLPGIGPVTAQKIIDHRLANGSFASIEAILEVSGIGPAKFEQIRELITTGS